MTSRMNMAASLYFSQNGVRTKYAEYRVMTGGGFTNLTYRTPMAMGNMPAVPYATPPSNLQPTVYQVQYNLNTNTMSATCFASGSVSNTTATKCMEGSYDPKNHFAMSINDTRVNTLTYLRATEKTWFSGRDEPSFTLKDVQSDGTLGKIAVETVGTDDYCGTVKLCLARGSDLDMMVPLGLTLAKHSENDMVACAATNNGAD